MTVSVYILKLANHSYYTGISKQLDKRINQHERGLSKSTKQHLPCQLIYFAECEGYSNARSLEKLIKNRGASRYLNSLKFH